MINPNDPVMPIMTEKEYDIPGSHATSYHKTFHKGLTIRAELAARFMAALMTNQEYNHVTKYFETLSMDAVIAADTLIDQLNKTEPK